MSAAPPAPEGRRTRNALAVFGSVEVAAATGLTLLLSGFPLPGFVERGLGGNGGSWATEAALSVAVMVFGAIFGLIAWDSVAAGVRASGAVPVAPRPAFDSWDPAPCPSTFHAPPSSLSELSSPLRGARPLQGRLATSPGLARAHHATFPSFRGVRR